MGKRSVQENLRQKLTEKFIAGRGGERDEELSVTGVGARRLENGRNE
jgi:hypothetical protein